MFTRIGGISTLTLVVCLLAATVAQAGTITVANTNDSGAGSLRAALAEAAPGETIILPAGEYTLASELSIDKSVTIDGAGASTTTVQAGGAFRVLNMDAAGEDVKIAGLTIRGGEAQPSSVDGAEGGGVLDEGINLTLEGVVVEEDHADADGKAGENGGIAEGGGVAAYGATLTLKRSQVLNNDASAAGGAGKSGEIAQGGGLSSSGPLVLDEVSVEANTVDVNGGQGASSSAQGGGIGQGGGIFLSSPGGDVSALTAVTIVGNVVEASAGPGAKGGIGGGGGAFLGPDATISVLDATVTANQVTAVGGGDGIAQGGGLMVLPEEGAQVTNATIDANAVDGENGMTEGGDLVADTATDVLNTIVSAGAGPSGTENCGVGATSKGHNIDSLDQCGFHAGGDKTHVQPLLGPLRDNGGFLRTEALEPESPAVDAGADSGCAATDARGVPRPQGAACDIGAFERAPGSAVTEAASALNVHEATLNATVANAGFLPGSFYFQWGTTTSYGQQTAMQPLTAQLEGKRFSAPLTGLTPGTTYHFRAVAIGAEGTGFGADRSFTTPVPPIAISPPSPLAPVLSGLAISPSRFASERGRGASLAARTPRGAAISYSDSETATTTFTVLVLRRGYRVGAQCRAKPPKHHAGRLRRCTLRVRVGSFTHADRVGAQRLRFTGRVGRRPLPAGRYVLQAQALSDGLRSRIVSAAFQIVG